MLSSNLLFIGSLQSLLNDAQNKSKKCDEEPGQNSDDSFDWEDGDNVDEDEEKACLSPQRSNL